MHANNHYHNYIEEGKLDRRRRQEIQAVKTSTIYSISTETANKVSTVRATYPHPAGPTTTAYLDQDTEVAGPSSPHN